MSKHRVIFQIVLQQNQTFYEIAILCSVTTRKVYLIKEAEHIVDYIYSCGTQLSESSSELVFTFVGCIGV